MYEPYPATEPALGPDRIPRPRTVRNAMRLMYLGAALEVPALIVAVVTRSTFKPAILQAHPGYTTAQLHTAEIARTVPLLIGAPIVAALWLWMAWANGRGRSWARVVSAAFFGINTVDLLISLALVHAAATMITGVIIWLVGLAAIVLIFSKDSAPFYTRQPAQR
jgi:hypothetical protein